jgi:hypothetical protein
VTRPFTDAFVDCACAPDAPNNTQEKITRRITVVHLPTAIKHSPLAIVLKSLATDVMRTDTSLLCARISSHSLRTILVESLASQHCCQRVSLP